MGFHFKKVMSNPPIPAGYRFAAATVSSQGNGLFAYRSEQSSDSASNFKILTVSPEVERWIELPRLKIRHPKFDEFSDGSILAVDSRCAWRATRDFDLNAYRIDIESGHCRNFLLGDGIQDLRIDQFDRIWVSYFDEGVFGNLGWGHPGPFGPGSGGLVCFDKRGKQLWSFNNSVRSGPFISDCYAMNGAVGKILICPYTEFDLHEVDSNFDLRTLGKPGVCGASTFSEDDGWFLFNKGYNDNPGEFWLTHFGKKKTKKKVLASKKPSKWIATGHTFGCGKWMHNFNKDGWFKVSIDEVKIAYSI